MTFQLSHNYSLGSPVHITNNVLIAGYQDDMVIKLNWSITGSVIYMSGATDRQLRDHQTILAWLGQERWSAYLNVEYNLFLLIETKYMYSIKIP